MAADIYHCILPVITVDFRHVKINTASGAKTWAITPPLTYSARASSGRHCKWRNP